MFDEAENSFADNAKKEFKIMFTGLKGLNAYEFTDVGLAKLCAYYPGNFSYGW